MKRLVIVILTLLATPAGATGTLGEMRNVYTHALTRIDGDVARTTVTQVFVNDLPTAVEVSYGFPLPAGASVTGFASYIDGRRIEARADDKAAADEAFDKAASEGKHAAVAEAESDRFRLRLTAVPAGATRRVELSYTQTLAALGGERSFVFPAGHGAPGILDVEVSVDGDRDLLGVASENHPDARIERHGRSFVARLSRSRGGLERDLALRWQTLAAPTDLAARAVRTVAGEPAYLEARFALNADPWPGARPPTDVIIVVDASLSMAGEPLARAVATARAIVAQAAPGDRVAIVKFAAGVDVKSFAPARTVAVDDLVAVGPSNFEAALDAAGELLPGARNPVIVLLTDGQPTAGDVGDTGLAARAKDFAGARVVVACFNYPSRVAFIDALIPHATTRYVPDGPAGETAAREIARLANAPVLEDLTVEIDAPGRGSVAGVVPRRLAVGENARILARVQGDATVRVRGTLHGAPVVLSAQVAVPDGPDAVGDRGLPVEWARLRVRDLDRVVQSGGAAGMVAREEIKALGKSYGLVTRYTSYVSTEESDSLAPDHIKPGDPELRIRAPRSAGAVRALLPWGETVECVWQEDEGLWLGRFLVPRGVADGMFQIRLFTDGQEGTRPRGFLWLRVDSKPPEMDVTVEEGRLVARPRRDAVLVVEDRAEVRRVVAQIDGRELTLTRRGLEDVWEAPLEPLDLAAGRHEVRLVAADPAGNSSETVTQFELKSELR